MQNFYEVVVFKKIQYYHGYDLMSVCVIYEFH